MTETCPVCDAPVEHVRIEEPEGTEAVGGTASFDVADLCAVEDDTRWDRICTAAGADGSASLGVYYHFFEE